MPSVDTQRIWGRTALATWLTSVCALQPGCLPHDRPNAPGTLLAAPGINSLGVALSKSASGYRVTSISKLNGEEPLREEPEAEIASGFVQTWQWQVKAVPALLSSWRAFEGADKTRKVRQRAERTGNWAHTAVGWDLAFERAHRVAQYLLGEPPPPMRATVLLVPDGVKYSRRVTETGAKSFPLTLAFYWPSSNPYFALMDAVSQAMYEYQHLLVYSGVIAPQGKTSGDRTANDEARSQCWHDSTFVALDAGTRGTIQWDLSQARKAIALLQLQESKRYEISLDESDMPARGPISAPFSEGFLWGRFLEVETMAAYLRERGVPKLTVRFDQPANMNSILSACRAMTQQPLDLTRAAYPPSQIPYVPFFPGDFGAEKGGEPRP